MVCYQTCHYTSRNQLSTEILVLHVKIIFYNKKKPKWKKAKDAARKKVKINTKEKYDCFVL